MGFGFIESGRMGGAAARKVAWAGTVLGLVVTLGAAAAGHATAPGTRPVEAPFLAENRAAMSRMMAGMEVKPSGDADRDFAAMMIAHHQGAIDMARAELRHGRNERLRRIAQGIVVEQQQEIAAMRLALDQAPLPPSAPGRPSGATSSPSLASMTGMAAICRSP